MKGQLHKEAWKLKQASHAVMFKSQENKEGNEDEKKKGCSDTEVRRLRDPSGEESSYGNRYNDTRGGPV